MNDNIDIAIIDDHKLFRSGLAMMINLIPGYEVILEAEDGQDFIGKLNDDRLPAIALLDISMTGMDGYETARWISQHRPEIKILALSTMDAETAIIKMIKCGAKGYILKDSDMDELKLAFSELLAKGFFYNDLVSKKIIGSIRLLTDNDSDITQLLKLTPRESEFIKLACSEKSYAEIAREMFIAERTVDGYREALFRKLHVTTRVGLVMYAIKNGLVKL